MVFPVRRYFMDMEYTDGEEPLTVSLEESNPKELEFCRLLLERALNRLGKKKEDLKGCLKMTGRFPRGAGLGASAALSASVASLMGAKGWLGRKHVKGFATRLENIFHGVSSGMDVAGILTGRPLLYQRGEIQKELPPPKQNYSLFLSHSGTRSSTSFGMEKVQAFLKEDPDRGKSADKDMARSAGLILDSFYRSKNREEGILLMKQALDLAEGCFKTWGLMSPGLKAHGEQLKSSGALAVKPTGSGAGGFVISLWDKAPAPQSKMDLIPLI